jgi:hypothetical protein
MAAVTVDITRIRLDGGTQIRESLYDAATLDEYFDAAEAGATFPPIHVVDDGNSLWLVDGFHRHAVAIRRGQRTIDAHIREGTLEEAQWLSCAANRGLARTHADKRAAIVAALRHPRSKGLSDRAIAAHCGVHQTTVGQVRSLMVERGEVDANQPRISLRGGKVTMPAPQMPKPKLSKLDTLEGVKPDTLRPLPLEKSVLSKDQPSDDDGFDGFDGYDSVLEDAVADEPAKVEKPSVLCDHQGREVPRCLVHKWVLLTRQYELTAATIVAAKNAGGQHRAALTRASKAITDGALVRHSDLDGWALGRALKQAEMSVERLRPWVVCSECDGTGGEHPAYCNYCGASGWLCPEDFQQRVDGANARNGKRGAR